MSSGPALGRPSSQTILVVDDDLGLRPEIEVSLERKGFDVVGAGTVADAIAVLQRRHVALALLDINLPDGSGLDVLCKAQELDDEIIAIMMTAYPDVKTAVRAMKAGASDYIVKPFELEDLHITVARAQELRSLRRDVQRLGREATRRNSAEGIHGESAPVRSMLEQIDRVAPTDVPVLIAGETGTGKELVAEAVHRQSQRSGMPLVKVNCSTFSETLLESELFGHERGAFTDAKRTRAGLFEMADGGTIFLDEIAEMKVGLQTKLLRVVEGHPFRRVGGDREIRANVRIVAATNRDLKAEVQRGTFREDLYFRLDVFPIRVPPLRERGEDIGLLARHFLSEACRNVGKVGLTLTVRADEVLANYPWPGNVRELRNTMERAAILADAEEVDEGHLPSDLRAAAFLHRAAGDAGQGMPSLAEMELRYMELVHDSVGGNISQTARILGVARNTLKGKMRPKAESPVEEK